jgi:hypothetical protein
MFEQEKIHSAKKAKTHIGLDINRGIPQKIFLTNGKGDERPFVSQILAPARLASWTAIINKSFDLRQTEGKHFVCRIKEKPTKTVIRTNAIKQDSIVFYDAVVLLGTSGVNQTEKELRVVGYRVGKKEYRVALTVTTFLRRKSQWFTRSPLEHRNLLWLVEAPP